MEIILGVFAGLVFLALVFLFFVVPRLVRGARQSESISGTGGPPIERCRPGSAVRFTYRYEL